MCTVINLNHTQSYSVGNTNTMDNSLNDTSAFTELSERSDDEDKEAFLIDYRTDVLDETLESYSDEEQSDTEFDTDDDNVEQEDTDKKMPMKFRFRYQENWMTIMILVRKIWMAYYHKH